MKLSLFITGVTRRNTHSSGGVHVLFLGAWMRYARVTLTSQRLEGSSHLKLCVNVTIKTEYPCDLYNVYSSACKVLGKVNSF